MAWIMSGVWDVMGWDCIDVLDCLIVGMAFVWDISCIMFRVSTPSGLVEDFDM
jgi:hypothetical protein